MHGDLGNNLLADFEDEVTLECEDGYNVYNTTVATATLTCLANETFGDVPMCVNRFVACYMTILNLSFIVLFYYCLILLLMSYFIRITV